jgi:hypothetical protein
MWIATRIEAAISRPVICLEENSRTMIARGSFPEDQRDTLVVKAAEFGGQAAAMPGVSHFGWHLRGTAILVGFRMFWTAAQRASAFQKVTEHMPACGPTAPSIGV